MGYLTTKDYARVIQTTELNAITGNDISIRQLVEGSVQSEMYANLKQQFDLDIEFKDTNPFVLNLTNKGGDRVYLDAPIYSPATTSGLFSAGDLTAYQGNVYYCITPITAQEPFTIAKWSLLGKQYDTYYVNLPYSLFEQDKFYHKGDIVFYKDKVYKAQQDSVIIDSEDAFQFLTIESIRRGNSVPGSDYYSAKMWGTGTSFSFTGLYVTNPLQSAWSSSPYTVGAIVSYLNQNYISVSNSTNIIPGTNQSAWMPVTWIKGDNRNQMFVRMVMDIVVYELCKRIAPNNVPEARHNAWVKAMKDVKEIAKGDVNAQLPTLKPLQGERNRFGGNTRETYSW